jgi:hypothetical protein
MFSLNDVGFLGSVNSGFVFDPNFANVSLLLHGDGTNGSTTITDNSPSPKTMTAVGNAQISTAQSKFGGASILFDGSGDRITTPSNSDFAFGTGDFTVEAWVRETSRVQYASLLEIGTHLSNGIIFLTNSGGGSGSNIGTYVTVPGGPSNFFGVKASASTGVWSHVAYVRSSGLLTCYVDGVGGSAVSLGQNLTSTSTITIGSRADGTGGNYDFNGYIDDLRITKGVARYTANFTPPTAPFPDA